MENTPQIGDQELSEKIEQKLFREELGASGTKLYGGILNEEYLPELSGQQGNRTYKKMYLSDAQVFATILACELPIRSTEWVIEGFEDATPQEEEMVKFVEKNIFENIDFSQFLFEVLSMLRYGYSLFERVYSIVDGKVELTKLAQRLQQSVWQWETQEGGAGVTQMLYDPKVSGENKGKTMISIPAEKLVLFSFRREGDNYEGVSVLRSCYRNWYIKSKLIVFDSIRQERLAAPIFKLHTPTNATQDEKTKGLNVLKTLRASEQTSVAIPGAEDAGWKVELLDTRNHQTTDILKSIEYHNKQISASVLAQFINLGNTESGSRAVSQDQSSFFRMGLQAVADQIAGIINKYVIKDLIDWNFEGVKRYPQIKPQSIENTDFDKLSTSLERLAKSGMVTYDENTENHIRLLFDLPPKEETEGEPEQNKQIKKAQIDEVDESEMEAKEREQYLAMSELIDNRTIIELQNECRTPQDLAELKKKGFKLNEYESKAFRPLTFAERKVNLVSINRALDTFENTLNSSISRITSKQKEDLLNQVKKAVESDDIAKVGLIKAKYKGELSQSLTDVQKEMFEIGKKSAAREMSVGVPPTKSEIKGAMRVQNDVMVGKYASSLENDVKQSVTELANKSGGITNVNTATAVGVASEVIDKVIKQNTGVMRTLAVTGALNTGRTSIFERYPEQVYAVQYSAILDGNTTYRCMSLDGRVVKAGSTEFVEYSPPQHYNCRSIWVEILEDETFKPNITGVPKSISPVTSIDTAQDLKKPTALLKDSPAIKVVQQEIAERQALVDKYKAEDIYPNRVKQHEERIKSLKSSIRGKFKEEIKSIIPDVKFKG